MDLNLNGPVYNSLFLKNNKSVVRYDCACTGYEEYNQVLCKEKLSGCCYFEVQWEGAGCSIVFSYNSATGFVFGSNNESWKCDFPISILRVQHDSQQTDISLVSKIGVFLDQAAGTVSFYNVSDKMTLLHRIQTTFNKPLFAGFSFQDWKDSSSVTICDLPKLNK